MITTTSDGVDLWWDLDGAGPAVVPIPGRGDSSDVYPTCFRDRLLAAGFSVLRFDPRDTGLSGNGGDTYTLVTMADDVVAVLDAAGIDRAHVVGLSMGGMILVDLASRQPGRTSSAIFLSTMSQCSITRSATICPPAESGTRTSSPRRERSARIERI